MRWSVLAIIMCGSIATALSFFCGFWWATSGQTLFAQNQSQIFPTKHISPTPTPLPYRAFSIPALRTYSFKPSAVVLEKEITTSDTYTSYQFSFTTSGKRMTGQAHIPTGLPALKNSLGDGYPIIIMARGWAPQENYATGTGTQPAARYFAERGYATLAPDFFGFGASDPAPEDSWIDRFSKPVAIIELLRSVQANPSLAPPTSKQPDELPANPTPVIQLDTKKIAFWGHSNGGQIMLSTLEILGEPIPTTLWAPVTAPFPYSILYFSDEAEDEGKETRKWISLFEENYDVFEFSITKNLGTLNAPLQIQHGTADTSALIDWSDAFDDLIAAENTTRSKTTPHETALPQIKLEYIRYPGVDHNMRPRWDDAVNQDLRFFSQELE